jgi:hypothetical protein
VTVSSAIYFLALGGRILFLAKGAKVGLSASLPPLSCAQHDRAAARVVSFSVLARSLSPALHSSARCTAFLLVLGHGRTVPPPHACPRPTPATARRRPGCTHRLDGATVKSVVSCSPEYRAASPTAGSWDLLIRTLSPNELRQIGRHWTAYFADFEARRCRAAARRRAARSDGPTVTSRTGSTCKA